MNRKKFLKICFGLLLLVNLGCATHRVTMPTMDIPAEPLKPKIHFEIVMRNNEPYLALKMPEGLQLLEYLIKTEVTSKEYRNRIETMNHLMGGK